MKRIISTAIAGVMALSLMGAPAMAAPRHSSGNDGAAIAAGIGLVALVAILASQNNDRDRGYEGRSYHRHDRDRGWRDRGHRNRDRGYRDRDWR